MSNYMYVNFYLRKSSIDPSHGAIYVRVTVNEKRLVFGAVTVISGLDLPKSMLIPCSDWNKAKQRVVQTNHHAVMINQAIHTCENRLLQIRAQYDGHGTKMTAEGLKTALKREDRALPSLPDLISDFLEERRNLGTKKSTINTYGWKFRPFQAFLKSESISNQAAEDFTPGTLKRFKIYLITQRKNSERSADKSCQVVKTLFLWAAGCERISKNPLLNIRIHVDKTPNLECLTQEELAIVREAKLIPTLRVAADCLEFACYTGLAYQDLKSLDAHSIQRIEGQPCIVGKRQKTGTDYCIPITEPIWKLMEKYNGLTLPLPKLGDYNPLLHQIMLSLGINKRITSHTARKTFADWCINELGLSEEATIVAMGQKNAKELTPYRKTRPKRLLSEFPADLLQQPQQDVANRPNPFIQIYKAS